MRAHCGKDGNRGFNTHPRNGDELEPQDLLLLCGNPLFDMLEMRAQHSRF